MALLFRKGGSHFSGQAAPPHWNNQRHFLFLLSQITITINMETMWGALQLIDTTPLTMTNMEIVPEEQLTTTITQTFMTNTETALSGPHEMETQSTTTTNMATIPVAHI